MSQGRKRTRGRLEMRQAWVIFFLLSSPLCWAADKEKKDEKMLPPPAHWKIPPAPFVPADKAVETLKPAPGFKAELVASDPMITHPVAMAFDGDGRLWVVEMRDYMPTVDAEGEDNPSGQISVLEDTDGDGKFDKSTVFIDKLVLPRAISLVKGGILIATSMPPQLMYCEDSNNDLKCDKTTIIAKDYGGPGNPEHTANGLLPGLDNWIYSADCTSRYRAPYSGGAAVVENLPAASMLLAENGWVRQRTNSRGQWGIGMDDYGRLFYNTNSDVLRVDVIPSHYLQRNPNFKGTTGVNFKAVIDQSAWPARINPGVNRGYQSKQLRPDGTLATVTAACGPGVYRGDLYPPEFLNNIFVCEPSGNLVKRNQPEGTGLLLTAKNPYDKAEFLGGLDERFRPVNCSTGPDGNLYIIDLYHGLLQHKVYITEYLRKQMLERGLDKPAREGGRIFRMVYEDKKSADKPHMSKDTPEQLVAHLSRANGWWRDTAQRILIEQGGEAAVPALNKLVQEGTSPLGRMHALWTLEGLGKLTKEVALAGMSDKDPHVRATAIRVSEPMLKTADKRDIALKMASLVNDEDQGVQLQLAYSMADAVHPKAELAWLDLFMRNAETPIIREAVISGMGGRELEFAEKLIKDPNAKNLDKILPVLAACVYLEANGTRITRMIEQVLLQKDAALQVGMLDGMTNAKLPGAKAAKTVEVKAQPNALTKLIESSDKKVAAKAKALEQLLIWPSKTGVVAKFKAEPLTPAQQEQFTEGKQIYLKVCAQCHMPNGLGEDGKAPPFVESEFINGPPSRIIRIVLKGLRGPVSVNGSTYNMEMPAVQGMDDATIAAVLTYVRREWEHQASPVSAEMVAKVREEVKGRESQWTEPELMKIK